MSMKKVVTEAFHDYSLREIKTFLKRSFEDIGFPPGGGHGTVLLKPNLVMGKAPEKAVNTHPVVVRAVAELLLDCSCDIHIGDSPGYESTERALKASGILEVIDALGLKKAFFNKSVTKESRQGLSPYRFFTFGEDPDAYDMIVNMPKLKSHGMMGLTLGVKNTFGFIPSLEKARWHLRAGQDRMMFASILVDIHRLIRPDVTILDGILVMDRDGPSSGRARHGGIMAVSPDAFALDHYVEGVLGFAEPTPVTEKALENALVGEYEVVGETRLRIEDFEMPSLMDTDWAVPGFVKRLLKRMFVKKPKVRVGLCKGCKVCVHVCPAQALRFREDRPTFDYKKCIRCYCCQEMCPEGAITV